MVDSRTNAGSVRIALGLLAVFAVVLALLVAAAAFSGRLAFRESTPPNTGVTTPTPEATAPASAPQTSVAPPAVPPPAPTPAPTPTPPERQVRGVVVIDAGHQARGDSSPEPIGPGARETKPKVATGTSGIVTRNPESLVNLQVALKLGAALQERGITVIQVRTKQDVNIANSARSEIANRADADLFVRLHVDGGPRENRGISTLVPARNRWTAPIVAQSVKAGRIVHRSLIGKTGAVDGGVVNRGDLTGFNWSTVPTILVEMGFMTNPEEDRRLASSGYQQRLADGMADGIVAYLQSR